MPKPCEPLYYRGQYLQYLKKEKPYRYHGKAPNGNIFIRDPKGLRIAVAPDQVRALGGPLLQLILGAEDE